MDASLVRRWVQEFNRDKDTVCVHKRSGLLSLITEVFKNVFATSLQMIDALNEPDYNLFLFLRDLKSLLVDNASQETMI